VRIDEHLAAGRGPVVSFEFMPPRTAEAELAFWAAIEELAALDPAFVSVTYGAGGSTRGLTLAVVRRLARERGLEAVPHLTCAGRDDLAAVVAGGARSVVALRGDDAPGADVLGLIAAAADAGLCVAAACYPEPHPQSRGWAADLAHLRAKLDAGASALITQVCFDPAHHVRFVERASLEVPVIPGIMPITSIAQIARITELCSATVPRALRRELEARQDDPAAVASLGVAYATAQAVALLEAGAPGVHLYTLNRSPATRAIVSALRAHGALAPATARPV
jgi:methylenetetrahydrofolate reductase (NADPH)